MISIVSANGTEHVIIDEFRYGKGEKSDSNLIEHCFGQWKCLVDSCPALISIDLDCKLTEYESWIITEHNHEPTNDEFEIQNGTIKLYRKRRALKGALPNVVNLPPPIPPNSDTPNSSAAVNPNNDSTNEDCENENVVVSPDLEHLLNEINEPISASSNHNENNNLPPSDLNFQFTQSKNNENPLICDEIIVNNKKKKKRLKKSPQQKPLQKLTIRLFENESQKKSAKIVSSHRQSNLQSSVSSNVVKHTNNNNKSKNISSSSIEEDNDLMTEDEEVVHQDTPLNRTRQSKRKCIQKLSRLNQADDTEEEDFVHDSDFDIEEVEIIRPPVSKLKRKSRKSSISRLKNGFSSKKSSPITISSNVLRKSLSRSNVDQDDNDDDDDVDDQQEGRHRLTESEIVASFIGKIPDIEIVESTHRKNHVLLNGFRYRFGKGLSDGTSAWRCVAYDCKARLRINSLKKSYYLWSQHSHDPKSLEANEDGVIKVRRKSKPQNPKQRTKHNSFAEAIENLVDELPSIEIVESAHGKQHIELDGFRYRLAQGWSDGSSTWRCPLTKCSGSIRFSMINSVTGKKKCDIFKHTHEPNRRKNEIKKVLREVRRRALTTDAAPIEIIKQCIHQANVSTDISVQDVMNQQTFTKILEKAKSVPAAAASTTSTRVQPVMAFTDDAIELYESVKGKQFIFVDGYRYRFGRQFADGFTYWRCSEKDCKGSMKINNTGDQRLALSEHFHLPNQGQNVVRKFANELKLKALTQPNDEPRKIIEECRSKVPKLVEHYLPSMAANLRMIKRTRQQLGPQMPTTAEKSPMKKQGQPDNGEDSVATGNVPVEVNLATSATSDEEDTSNMQQQQQLNNNPQQTAFGIANLINQPCTAPTIDFANVFHLSNYMED